MYLHELTAPKGARKRRKVVGRGRGSGHGKTSGRGHTGQKSRAGRGVLNGSEGGQMPLIRRLPKVGFNSHRPVVYQVVQLESLNKFDKDTAITPEVLKAKGLISSVNRPIKILDKGKINKALIVQIQSVSQKARAKIVEAGGKIEFFDKNSDQKKKESEDKS